MLECFCFQDKILLLRFLCLNFHDFLLLKYAQPFLNILHVSVCYLSDESLCCLSTLKTEQNLNFPNSSFSRHMGSGWHPCCMSWNMGFWRCYIWRQHVLGLLCLSSGCCHDFLWVDFRHFLAGMTFLLVLQRGILAGKKQENASLQSEVNLGDDTHTWKTSQPSRWIRNHFEIRPAQHNYAHGSCWNTWLYCTVLYTVLYIGHPDASCTVLELFIFSMS